MEWVAISFSNAGKWKVTVKLLSRVQLLATSWTAAHQAPLSMGFSRQEFWSGLPLPSPLFISNVCLFVWGLLNLGRDPQWTRYSIWLENLKSPINSYIAPLCHCHCHCLRKGRGTRDQIANIRWIIEKVREFQKFIYFCFIDYDKALTLWITINCGKFWKRWAYQTIWPASWETCMQVRKQQLELDMEQQTGSK